MVSADPLAGTPEAFLQAKAEATAVGGRVVYGEL